MRAADVARVRRLSSCHRSHFCPRGVHNGTAQRGDQPIDCRRVESASGLRDRRPAVRVRRHAEDPLRYEAGMEPVRPEASPVDQTLDPDRIPSPVAGAFKPPASTGVEPPRRLGMGVAGGLHGDDPVSARPHGLTDLLPPRPEHPFLGTLSLAAARAAVRQLSAVGPVRGRRAVGRGRRASPAVSAARTGGPADWQRCHRVQSLGRHAVSARGAGRMALLSPAIRAGRVRAWRDRLFAVRPDRLHRQLSQSVMVGGGDPLGALGRRSRRHERQRRGTSPYWRVVTALQAFAGEPVTLLATLVVGLAFAAIVSLPPAAPFARTGAADGVSRARSWPGSWPRGGPTRPARPRRGTVGALRDDLPRISGRCTRWRSSRWCRCTCLATTSPANRLVVTAVAPGIEQRTGTVPVLDLFRRAAPGRRAVRSGRWRPSRWTLFWTGAGAASLLSAFGAYTPVYPFLRDHLPLLSSLRFPAKYLVIWSMVVPLAPRRDGRRWLGGHTDDVSRAHGSSRSGFR